jgi:DNA-binding GntR family transcriptional regulator
MVAELPRYQVIANDLRNAIYQGEYPPGAQLPQRTELMERYGVSQETASKAYRELAKEGLVEVARKRGARVRRHPERRQITRERTVYRDEIGYFFDQAAQDWRALAPTEIGRVPAPWDIARLMNVPVGSEVVIRARIMGDPDTHQVHQLTASFLSLDLVDELPVLEQANTGQGGIYARLEEAGHGPLAWYERLSARAATAREVELLRLAPGVPVQRIIRTTTDPAGKVCEVNAISLNAELHEIGYPLERDVSAQSLEP